MTDTQQGPKLLFKVVVVGDCGSGKSALIIRYTDGVFNESYISTIGVDFRAKDPQVDGAAVTLQIWDTAGQERFKTITRGYWRGADAIIIVYSVTQRETFQSVTKWADEINACGLEDTVKILVASKVDLAHERIISTEQGENLAKSLGMPYMETSAKNAINVDELFIKIATELRDRKLEEFQAVREQIGKFGEDEDGEELVPSGKGHRHTTITLTEPIEKGSNPSGRCCGGYM